MTGPDETPLPPDNRAFQELHNRFALDVDRAVSARSEAGLAAAVDRYRASDTPKDEAWAEERVRQALSAIRGQPQTAEAAWAFILGGPEQTALNNEGPLDFVRSGSSERQPAASGGGSTNTKTFGILAILAALAIGAYLLFGQGGDNDATQTAQGSQGIRIFAGQPVQPQGQPTRTAQQPQTQPPATSGGDQVLNVTMQFTQSLVRTEGRCPPNVPAAGFDFSPKTTTKVTINKTKRTIVIENTDGTKSDVATYDPATGLAVITYQGAPDNRSSIVKVSDTALDGESTFFPYRAAQGSQQFPDCKFVLKTSAKLV